MRWRRTLPALLVLASANPLAVAAAPAPGVAPLDSYPVSAPSPLGSSIPPEFVDEDETVRARIDASGHVTSLVDDALIKIRGSGDYVLQLPARVSQVANLGGDSVPGLQDGHVSFLGHAVGAQQLGVEATLDIAQAKTLPLSIQLSYAAGGRVIPANDVVRARGPVTVTLVMTNLTAQPHAFVRGSASAAPLARVLDALRQAGGIYIPEVNLGDQLPVPAALPIQGPTRPETRDTFVPLAMTVSVKLPAGVSVTAPSPGADLTVDSHGTRLSWTRRLPATTEAPGVDTLSFTVSGGAHRPPALAIRADPLPLPAAVFTAPGGGSWAAYLGGRPDRAAETVLAQEGMASLHRIGELAQPLGRPGPGPVKVKYDFILDSVDAPRSPPTAPRGVRGQPAVVLLTIAATGAAALYAARTWARH
ncbi:MAG: hypothetical protein NVS3B24_09460 [Candidatus Dormibacteria bacterium]